MDVQAAIGPGLLESAYEVGLDHERMLRQDSYVRRAEARIAYKGTTVECGVGLDLLVGDVGGPEVKAVERLLPIHCAPLLTHLSRSGKRVGLLINSRMESLRDGIVRRVLRPGSVQLPLSAFNSVKLRATPW
ncbi:MAG: GxxExxY protein [Leptolyngbya sp. PLA3]|nr:MAG: GxxExxY protein [Cyanobacteria bacterium CYA]MCE7969045.1 GxxExxY protein [Leptolyngbya sp. PL-A3]